MVLWVFLAQKSQPHLQFYKLYSSKSPADKVMTSQPEIGTHYVWLQHRFYEKPTLWHRWCLKSCKVRFNFWWHILHTDNNELYNNTRSSTEPHWHTFDYLVTYFNVAISQDQNDLDFAERFCRTLLNFLNTEKLWQFYTCR